jgi:hypothetical protein
MAEGFLHREESDSTSKFFGAFVFAFGFGFQ